jgi:thiol peroxidase
LPFAFKRFCGAEGIDNLITASDFVSGQFGKDYNLQMTSGPLANLHSRVIIVLDESGKIIYTEQVPEIADEPNYEAALASL